MAKITIDNISELWNYLGSVWGNLSLEDKAFIEEIWKAYSDVIQALGDDLTSIQTNRSIHDISPVITELDNYYDIIYDTTDDDTYGHLKNTFLTPSGLIGYQFNDMVIDVSGVVNYHYVDESNPWIVQTLVEGVDFVISGYNSIIFLNDPPFTNSVDYPTLNRSTIYIGKLEKINPMLFRVWGEQLAFNSDIYVDESYDCWSQETTGLTYKQNRAEHYRQIIRALRYWSFQVPTMKVMKHSTGIAYGLPFSYDSGILSHVVTELDPTIGTNIINATESDFEGGVKGDWSAGGGGSVNTTDPYHLLYSYRINGGTTYLDIGSSDSTSVDLVPGQEYRLSIFFRWTTVDTVVISVDKGSGDTVDTTPPSTTIGEYQEIVVDFTCDGPSPRITLDASGGGGTGHFRVDYITLKSLDRSYTYHAEINDQELWVTNSGELSYLVEGYHDRFELLVDSYNFYDYISYSSLIEAYMDPSGVDKRNILVAEISDGLADTFPFTKNDDMYAEWLERIIPKHTKFVEITTNTEEEEDMMTLKSVDLNQAAATYDLFTGTAQTLMIDSIVVVMPNAIAGGALTKISIQTDHTTPQVFIPNTLAVVADMNEEVQFSWSGKTVLEAGNKIQLTITGGAVGTAYVAKVYARYQTLVSGGVLVAS